MRLAMALLVLTTLTGCTVKYDLQGTDWKKSNTMLPQTTQERSDRLGQHRPAQSDAAVGHVSLDAAAGSDDRPDARADALAQHVVAHVVVAAEAAAQLGHHAARTVGHVARRRVDGVGR